MTPTYTPRTTPMRHQRHALRYVIGHQGRALLLCDPGMGKSKVAIDYMAMLARKFGTLRVLVVAPLSALDTWPDQLDQHMPTPELERMDCVMLDDGAIVDRAALIMEQARADLEGRITMVVVNHDVFASRRLVKGLKTVTVADRMVTAIKAFDPDLVIVDEIHRFKNHNANRSRALVRAIKGSPRVLGLTGTVAPRNILDVYGQWKLVNPDRWPQRYTDFEERFALKGGWMGREIIGWQRLDEFRDTMLKDAFVARKSDSDMDLPPTTDVIVPVRLSPKERRLYTQMAEEMIAELGSHTVTSPQAIVKILRLRQITGGMIAWTDEEGEGQAERIGTSKLRVARDKMQELVEAGEKVVVFAHFREDVRALAEEARKLKPKPGWVAAISGSTPQSQRMQLRKGFAGWDGPAVMVAQMRTMSLAVNELVVSCNAIYFSMSERRDDYDQSRDRLNRKGQTRPITFHHLVVPDSIDTLMLRAHREKLALEHAVTDIRADLGLS